MTLDARRLLRDAFGTFMTGVTVVTTLDPEQGPLGFTANSFSSVSLDPPLLLVSIARSSANFGRFAGARGFAINVLSEGQRDVSNTFARPSDDRFAAVAWRPGPHGAPILDGVSAWFGCGLHQVIKAGDHAVLIGRVEAFEGTSQPGLGYWRGSYFTPVQTAAAIATGPAVVVSAIIERGGEVLLVDDGQGGLTLPTVRAGQDGASAALRRLIVGTGIEAAPGLLYSVYEDDVRGSQHLVFLCPAADGAPAKGAGFVELTPSTLGDVTDPAFRTMLERLAEEATVGSYGIYVGNQNAGQVRRVAEGTS